MTVGGVALRLMRSVLPTMLGSRVELPLPQLMAEDDDRPGGAVIGLDECAADGRLEADDAEIVVRHQHALQRLAAVRLDEKVEGPGVRGDRVERGRLLLPFHPLDGSPGSPIDSLLTLGPVGRNQDQLLRLLIGRGRQEDALNQGEHGGGRTDAQGQRERGDDREPGLFAQHAPGKP